MVFMRSSIRNLGLFNNTLIEVNSDEIPDEFREERTNENQDESPEELTDEVLYEFSDELLNEISDNPAILLIVSFRGRTFYYFDEETSPKKSVISKNQFESFEKNCNSIACPICMEDSDENIILPCDHVFCSKCIEKWLLKNTDTCPNCRKSVVI
jgi:hypothetical protein